MNELSGIDVATFTRHARFSVQARAVSADQEATNGGDEHAIRRAGNEHNVHRGDRSHHGQHGHRIHGPRERGGQMAIADSRSGASDQTVPKQMAVASEGSVAMTYRSSGQTSLFIKTQEGDTVRLKIQTSEAVKLSASRIEDGDQLVKEMQLQGASGTQIKFFVNGDLNSDELSAITNVIDQAGLLAEDFFASGVNSAFQAASALDIDGQQLAKVGLKLSAREQFTYTQQGVRAGAPTRIATEASKVAPTASLPPPTTVATAPSATNTQTAVPPPPSVATPTPSTISSAAVAAAVTANMAATEDPDVAAMPPDTATAAEPTPAGNPAGFMASVFGAISDFLNRMIETFDDVQAANDESEAQAPDTPSISMELKLRIFESVLFSVSATTIVPAAETQSSATSEVIGTDDSGPLPALVAETIDAVAANQHAPLHALA